VIRLFSGENIKQLLEMYFSLDRCVK